MTPKPPKAFLPNLPPPPPPPPEHQIHSPLLSISRSPFILSSGPFVAPLPFSDIEAHTAHPRFPDTPSDDGAQKVVYDGMEEEEEVDERLDYVGGFQPPDMREAVGVALSFGAVVVLALAAGLTTIYDWVL